MYSLLYRVHSPSDVPFLFVFVSFEASLKKRGECTNDKKLGRRRGRGRSMEEMNVEVARQRSGEHGAVGPQERWQREKKSKRNDTAK